MEQLVCVNPLFAVVAAAAAFIAGIVAFSIRNGRGIHWRTEV